LEKKACFGSIQGQKMAYFLQEGRLLLGMVVVSRSCLEEKIQGLHFRERETMYSKEEMEMVVPFQGQNLTVFISIAYVVQDYKRGFILGGTPGKPWPGGNGGSGIFGGPDMPATPGIPGGKPPGGNIPGGPGKPGGGPEKFPGPVFIPASFCACVIESITDCARS